MSHDAYAALACTEIAKIIKHNQNNYFANSGATNGWTIGTGREGGRRWPLADGVISSYHPSIPDDIQIAIEFKRVNEGLHGTLTALGQSLAYLHKGYHASIIVIPKKYSSHETPAEHLKEVLDLTANSMPIGVFGYEEPDLNNSLNPFEGKITCYRLPNLNTQTLTSNVNTSARPKVSTLWAHVREGMSYPDAFYKYCKQVKLVAADPTNRNYALPQPLIDAIQRIKPGVDPLKYLSYTTNDSLLDRAWLNLWFQSYFHQNLIPIFTKDVTTGNYLINDTETLILQNETQYAKIFSGRRDSIKYVLVDQLNNNSINEDQAWEEYAEKVRKGAHSYREVIDSGLYHLNLIDNNGNLTNIGYRFVDEADKESSVYASTSMQILRGTALTYGNFSAFLHYFYQLSEELFKQNPMDFSTIHPTTKKIKFDNKEYRVTIYTKMRDELSLLLTSSIRSPSNPREPFQAEIPFLKYLDIIPNDRKPFRSGVGLLINWPLIQETIDFMRENHL